MIYAGDVKPGDRLRMRSGHVTWTVTAVSVDGTVEMSNETGSTTTQSPHLFARRGWRRVKGGER